MSGRSKRAFSPASLQKGGTIFRNRSKSIEKIKKPELFHGNKKKTDNWINQIYIYFLLKKVAANKKTL